MVEFFQFGEHSREIRKVLKSQASGTASVKILAHGTLKVGVSGSKNKKPDELYFR